MYQESTGSKYTTIQFQFPCKCLMEDIRQVIYNQNFPEVANPHQVAYFATILPQVLLGIQELKAKIDPPIQFNFGMHDSEFLISLSFTTDVSSVRLASKMLIQACFLKNFAYVGRLLKKFQKPFLEKYGGEKIENSLKFMQKNSQMSLMSKADYTKILLQSFEKQVDQSISQNPIPTQNFEIDLQMYTKFPYQLDKFDPVITSLFLSSINGQGITYVVRNNTLYFRKNSIQTANKKIIQKFIEGRLDFTAKNKSFADLTKKQKENTTGQKYDALQLNKNFKKSRAVMQIILSLAAISQKSVFSLSVPLSKINLKNQEMNIKQLISGVDDVIKIS